MPLEKSEALVLRVIPFRETSKVITAYTAERGLVSLLAKGVRAARPRFGAALEIFALADLVYYHKDSRELQLLSEAHLLDPHLRLADHPLRYSYAVGVLEFLLKVLTGQEAPGRLYSLSLRTLEVLETSPLRALVPVFLAFEIKAMSFLGHRPELFACVECGRSADGKPGVGFSPRLGGVLCPACGDRAPDVLDLPAPVWGLLRSLLTATLARIEAAPPGGEELAGARRVIEPFLQAHVDRYESLRAVRMAGSIRQ